MGSLEEEDVEDLLPPHSRESGIRWWVFGVLEAVMVAELACAILSASFHNWFSLAGWLTAMAATFVCFFAGLDQVLTNKHLW